MFDHHMLHRQEQENTLRREEEALLDLEFKVRSRRSEMDSMRDDDEATRSARKKRVEAARQDLELKKRIAGQQELQLEVTCSLRILRCCARLCVYVCMLCVRLCACVCVFVCVYVRVCVVCLI